MIAADGRDVWHSSGEHHWFTNNAFSTYPLLQSLRKSVILSLSRIYSHLIVKTQTWVFISEITARAFIIADSNKRRTLSRSDISKALSKSDQFDFLIDIVPREDAPFGGSGITQHTLNLGVGGPSNSHERQGESSGRDQVRWLLSMFLLWSLTNGHRHIACVTWYR